MPDLNFIQRSYVTMQKVSAMWPSYACRVTSRVTSTSGGGRVKVILNIFESRQNQVKRTVELFGVINNKPVMNMDMALNLASC